MNNKIDNIKEYNDNISELNVTEEDITISEELDFSSDRNRMYSKYKEHGFSSFHEHEVLEMLLYNCIPRKDTNPMAHKLINEYGNLQNVLCADVYSLQKSGLTTRAALILTQYNEINSYLRTHRPIKNIVLSSVDIAGEFCCERFGYNTVETFNLISMTANRRIISVDTISTGTAFSTEAKIAHLVKIALHHNAKCITLCHNHPSGDINPSNEDCSTTQHIVETMENIGIYVADHIICYRDRFTSFTERGIL